MVKTRSELETMLNTLNIQVFYDHTTKSNVVNTPYIVYFETASRNTYADNSTYAETMNYSVILFNHKRDETLENSIKTLFTSNHIPYDLSDIDWQEDLLLWSSQFDITI